MPLFIDTGNSRVDAQLSQILGRYHVDLNKDIYVKKGGSALQIYSRESDDKAIKIPLPLRAGNLISKMRMLQKSLQKNIYETDRFLFNFSEMHFTNKANGKKCVLTEKECDLLAVLIKNGKTPMARDNLLEEIWSYGKNIETHTLETHIYRLRQKIEIDPAKPEILIKNDNGYFIKTD